MASARRGHEKGKSLRQKQDDSIMDTNSSSIVSKRSVSKLYYPLETDFYAPFAPQFRRRHPLINRGYWLRMRAIEHTVKCFLESCAAENTSAAVVNLGCGYDPLPFQLFERCPSLSRRQGTIFVDVDYPQLMRRKRDKILECDILRDCLADSTGPKGFEDERTILLRAAHYAALGCDLRDLRKLKDALLDELDPADYSILFVAEVSVTYMQVADADALITWAAALTQNVSFCLLEQYLPDGASHPFAETMLQHFKKINSTIHGISKYPSLADQRRRFLDLGWANAEAESLWQLWQDESAVDSITKQALQDAEPFDEWEELALFAGHYFVLHASTNASPQVCVNGDNHRGSIHARTDCAETEDIASLAFAPNTAAELLTAEVKSSGEESRQLTSISARRFGAIYLLDTDRFAINGGMGSQSRLSSTHVYHGLEAEWEIKNDSYQPGGLLCHTISALKGDRRLLVGGRRSPNHAIADCWIIRGDGSQPWEKAQSLHPGRFRHCAVSVSMASNSSDGSPELGVLISGGVTGDGDVLDIWHLWHSEKKEWCAVKVTGARPPPRFGASMATIPTSKPGGVQEGLLMGGMTKAGGLLLSDVWHWELLYPNEDGQASLTCHEITSWIASRAAIESLSRFGGVLHQSTLGLLLIGGVCRHRVLPQDEEILSLHVDAEKKSLQVHKLVIRDSQRKSRARPLLIGLSAVSIRDDEVLILGGGAVCFSFGSFHNWSPSLLRAQRDTTPENITMNGKEHRSHSNSLPGSKHQLSSLEYSSPHERQMQDSNVKPVPRVQSNTKEEFDQIIVSAQPVIIEGLDIGPCTNAWTSSYLTEHIGKDKAVIVHSCPTQRMTFQQRNFSYVSQPFGDFMRAIEAGEQLYLRSVASNQPAKKPTVLTRDFPSIAEDFRIPEALSTVRDNMHSSPLRISGPVTLWLHYDVMANILCQIRGEKTLRLYHPADAVRLQIPPGGSSSNMDVFSQAEAGADGAAAGHPHDAELRPGDVLYIPPTWLHAARPTEGVSVAVNVFFRNLDEASYAPGRDVYGNRDLAAYEAGRKAVDKMAKSFVGLPGDVARFYMARLAEELRVKASEM